MADEADRAQAASERELADILAAPRPWTPPPLRDRNGQRICRDCREPIEAARIAASPSAARCIDCQERAELLVRQGRPA